MNTPPTQQDTGGEKSLVLALPDGRFDNCAEQYHFSHFHLAHVSQSPALVSGGDTCRETCKLECHSGAPFAEMDEEAPEPVIC